MTRSGRRCRAGLCSQDYYCWQTQAAHLWRIGQDWSAAAWQRHKRVA